MRSGGASNTLWWITIGALVLGLLAPVLVTVLLLGMLYNPPGGDLPTPKQGIDSRITRIYDSSGNQLGNLHRFDTHIQVNRTDIPQNLKDAVVSIEDKRFYSHSGLDLKALVRALWADLQGGSYEQGGSTITQQYVKRNYTGPKRTLSRKIREAALAGRVENKLSKDEILYRYVSDVYLGTGAYGVGAAAENYFRKPVNELTLSESATLAGLIQKPSSDEPRSNTGAAEVRRETVLRAMLDQGRITDSEYSDAMAQRLRVATAGTNPSNSSSSATYVYPPEEVQSQYPYFVDYVRRYLIAKFGEDEVYEGGLKVETTIDARLQGMAESAVSTTLRGTSAPLDMALVSVEPGTGFVKALVGGRDFTQSQVNLALGNCSAAPKPNDGGPVCIDGGGSGRQPGSSFKPFTLAKAFEEGITPEKVYNAPAYFTQPNCRGNTKAAGCTIGNAEPSGFGSLTVRAATAYSVNTVFAQLVLDVGIPETAEMAHRLGITMLRPDGKKADGKTPFQAQLTLGEPEVSPLDMASAYSVFANRGVQFPATPVLKVTDAHDKVLEDDTSRSGHRVIQEVIADNVTDVLKGVITGGTGTAADIGRQGTAGKTGTAETFSDAWFVGYSQKLATSVWMGHSDSQEPLIDIKGVHEVFGGTFPAMTWKDYMGRALDGQPDVPFPPPGELPRASTTTPGSGAGTSDTAPYVPPPYDPTATAPPDVPVATRPPRPAFSVPPYQPPVPTTASPATTPVLPTTTIKP